MNEVIQAVMQKYNVTEEQARKAIAVAAVAAHREQQSRAAGGEFRSVGGGGEARGMMDMLGGLLGGGQSGGQSGGMDAGDMMNMLNGLMGSGGSGSQQSGGSDEMMNMLMQMLGGSGAPAQQSSPAQSPVQPWPNQPAPQQDNIASQGSFGGQPGKKKESANLENALSGMASASDKLNKLGAKPGGVKKDKGGTGKQSVEKDTPTSTGGTGKKKKR